MTELILSEQQTYELSRHTSPRQSFFELSPQAMVNKAAAIASVLADVIEKQRLFQMIQGKKYVKHEGWATLGSILGILPREKSVTQLDDGSYEAVVELYNIGTNQVVGQGSAICGVDEKRWANADRYARRSMAITRATGKAYRLGFSWIMSLAGYEVTPAEEMPDAYERQTRQHQNYQPQHTPAEVVEELPKPDPNNFYFDQTNKKQVEKLGEGLRNRGVDSKLDLAIKEEMHGKFMTKETASAQIDAAVAKIMSMSASEVDFDIPFPP